MILFYFTDLAGLAGTTQFKMATEAGMNFTSPTWIDTAKTFPVERDKMLKALRPRGSDTIWIASLPVIAANRVDLRHVINVLTAVGASILEGATGWKYEPPYEQSLGVANCFEYWGKRRKLLDDPRGNGKAARNGAKPKKMPEADARMIWFDPTISTEKLALEKMNSDPNYRGEWKSRTAYAKFGKHGRPPGARSKPRQPEHES